jgi:D-xylonolactonase
MEEVATGFGLIEGPVWDAASGALYFSDVHNGGIYRLTRDGAVETVIQRRRGVGGMALHASGGLIFSGRDISYAPLGEGQGEPATLLTPSDLSGGAIGFNDLTTDPQGRIYVGSLAFVVFGGGEPKPGSLHVINLDGSTQTVSTGVLLTNGLGFSPDGSKLYHSDSRSELVRVYDLKPGNQLDATFDTKPNARLDNWRTFARFPRGGVPDGLKVASDGSVWVADARRGRVAVFDPDGHPRADVEVPLPMVTSLCFGGEDLKDLYIVTGSDGGPKPNCGTIFKLRVDVAGQPLAKARVKPQTRVY